MFIFTVLAPSILKIQQDENEDDQEHLRRLKRMQAMDSDDEDGSSGDDHRAQHRRQKGKAT